MYIFIYFACAVLGTCRWSRPTVKGNIPGARDGHSACLVHNYIYIFGGYEERVRTEGVNRNYSQNL